MRVAAPVDQLRATNATPSVPSLPAPMPTPGDQTGSRPSRTDAAPLLPPTDITSRTEYPRPWLGGRWTLRDIVDYDFIATMALLETAADRRETLLRQIHEVNRQTVEEGQKGEVTAILLPLDGQHDAARSHAPRGEAGPGGRRSSSRRRAVRDREPAVRRRHVRDSDDAGVCALRQGSARGADLSGRPARRAGNASGAALRRDRVVARAALRRRAELRARASRGRPPVAD